MCNHTVVRTCRTTTIMKITVSVSRCISTNESESWCHVSTCMLGKRNCLILLACLYRTVTMCCPGPLILLFLFSVSLQNCSTSSFFLCLPDKDLSFNRFLSLERVCFVVDCTIATFYSFTVCSWVQIFSNTHTHTQIHVFREMYLRQQQQKAFAFRGIWKHYGKESMPWRCIGISVPICSIFAVPLRSLVSTDTQPFDSLSRLCRVHAGLSLKKTAWAHTHMHEQEPLAQQW